MRYDTKKREAFHTAGVIDDVDDILADEQTGDWNIPGNTGELRNAYFVKN